MSFPWRAVMRAGLGVLKIPPEQFWRMTLKELAAALGQRERADAQALRDLMKRFPDV